MTAGYVFAALKRMSKAKFISNYWVWFGISKCVDNQDKFGLPARTAQGGGGSFKGRKPIGEAHGWQSKSTVGSKKCLKRRPIFLSIYLLV